MTPHGHPPDSLSALRALVDLSTVDLLYADLYLERAGSLLPQLCSREQYQALRHDQERLPSLAAQLRRAAERGDWSRLRSLAQEAASARERLAVAGPTLSLADAIYGPRTLHGEPTTLALNGVVAQPEESLLLARDTVLEQLRSLVAHDAEWAPFYRSRIAYFEHCQIAGTGGNDTVLDAAQLQQSILSAISDGNFARVERLTELIAAEPTALTTRMRIPRAAGDRLGELQTAFTDPVVKLAGELGLTMVRVPRAGNLDDYMSCCCAERATFPESPLGDVRGEREACTCGHACPPEVSSGLRENLDFLIGHPYISSAGFRYLPWFGAETLLVETFAETDPDASSRLLEVLGLRKRRGLARLAIENALLTKGPRVYAELGVEAEQFVVACIPFDVYVRLAPQFGWGEQDLWTHFDGYQVTRDLRLWAMVGGNARFGGIDNLSSVVRDYDSGRLVARFALLRRRRFLTREARADAA